MFFLHALTLFQLWSSRFSFFKITNLTKKINLAIGLCSGKRNASLTRGKGYREYVIQGFSPDLSALKG